MESLSEALQKGRVKDVLALTEIGADSYSSDAASAAELASSLIAAA